MDNTTQFIDWLCGKKVPFPFFQDMPEVGSPIGFENCEHCKDTGEVLVGNDEEFCSCVKGQQVLNQLACQKN